MSLFYIKMVSILYHYLGFFGSGNTEYKIMIEKVI